MKKKYKNGLQSYVYTHLELLKPVNYPYRTGFELSKASPNKEVSDVNYNLLRFSWAPPFSKHK